MGVAGIRRRWALGTSNLAGGVRLAPTPGRSGMQQLAYSLGNRRQGGPRRGPEWPHVDSERAKWLVATGADFQFFSSEAEPAEPCSACSPYIEGHLPLRA